MTSLVAAGYGSSSDDENDSEHEARKECESNNDCSDSSSGSNSDGIDENEQESRVPDANNVPLPSASALLATSTPGLVFNNPFKLAENAQIASLEKHVKMVESEEKTKTKNGKKICWNFRKGRCRFGSNCTYAHDSDLHQPEEGLGVKAIYQTPHEGRVRKSGNGFHLKERKSDKKRPGLSNDITPSKKVMNHYHNTKSAK